MLDLLLKLIRALLASLYTLFEGVPALEALRAWFGPEGGGGAKAAGLLLAGLALLLGLAAFLLFLWLLKRTPAARRRGAPVTIAEAKAGTDESERGSAA